MPNGKTNTPRKRPPNPHRPKETVLAESTTSTVSLGRCGLGKGGITGYRNQRLGRKCHLKEVNSKCKNIWRGSLSEEGPKLFNSLPSHIRNITNCTKVKFKQQLDCFLSTLPDKPLLPNYYPYRRADSNSVKEMVNHRISKLDD